MQVLLDTWEGNIFTAEPEAPGLMDTISMLLVLGLMFGMVAMVSGAMKGQG